MHILSDVVFGVAFGVTFTIGTCLTARLSRRPRNTVHINNMPPDPNAFRRFLEQYVAQGGKPGV